MTPSFTMDNRVNCGLCNAIQNADFFLTKSAVFVQLADFWNVCVFQSGTMTCFTAIGIFRAGFTVSSFPVSVSHVFGMSGQEKMIGSYTSGIIAFMTNVQSVENRTKVEQPRNPVSITTFPVNVYRTPVAVRTENYTIPTIIRFMDIAPEPFFDGAVAVQDTTCVATAKSAAVAALGRFNLELFTADVTTNGKHWFAFLHDQNITQDGGRKQDLLVGETLAS
jgi:hypothetical protein